MPSSAKVELRKEGSNNALQTQELNAAGSWKHTFTGLDKYENNGIATKDIVYLTADEEDEVIIAQANEPLDENGRFVNERVSGQYHHKFQDHRIS